MLDTSTFELLEGSPCIAAGVNSIEINGTWYTAPPTDLKGNIRPHPTPDQRVDLGALESPYGCTSPYVSESIINVPCEQPTIQAGIDAASDGDTVLVANGRYYENINFKGKAITVASHFLMDDSTSHISKTVIDGSQPVNPQKASSVTIENVPNSKAALVGFTITGGSGTLLNTYFGGGIYINGNGAIIESNVIQNIIMEKESAGAGIAAFLSENDTLLIKNNTVEHNEIITTQGLPTAAGIGVANYGKNAVVRISNNVISNNKVTNTAVYKAVGAGLYIDSEYSYGADIQINNNIIEHNELHCQSSFGGGIYVVYKDGHPTPVTPTQIKIYNNLVANNYSEDKGGGIAIWNMAKYAYPSVNFPTDPILINNTLTGNRASDGAGIYNYDATTVLINNILWDSITGETCREIFQDSLVEYDFCPDPCWPIVKNKGTLHLYNNCIKGGWEAGMEEEWEGTWSGRNNINKDPMFNPGLFELLEGSPCIGNGTDSVEISGTSYNAPHRDFYDSIRPHPIDSLVDLGAIESEYLRTYGVGIREYFNHTNSSIVSVYPNPFRSYFKVEMENNVPIQKVEILGLDGRILRVADNLHINPVTIERGDLPSGLYILRIHAEELYIKKVLVQ
jgi:hypothetical protein